MFVELKQPEQVETKEVNYLGGDINIPAHHEYVAIIALASAFGGKQCLASFANEPVLSESKVQYVPVDNDFAILGEIEMIPQEQLAYSLRCFSDDQSVEAVLLHNTEELVHKLKHVLMADEGIEAKLHEIFCPEHGIIMDFLEVVEPQVLEFLEARTATQAQDDAPASLIDALLASATGRIAQHSAAIDKAEAEAAAKAMDEKPRIRIIQASSFEDAIAQAQAHGLIGKA